MIRRQWWEKPRLRIDEEEERERRVGPLELFYDLVFVVVISQLAHHLAGHISVEGVIGFIGSGFGSITLLWSLLLLLLVQMVYAAYVWFRQPIVEPTI